MTIKQLEIPNPKHEKPYDLTCHIAENLRTLITN